MTIKQEQCLCAILVFFLGVNGVTSMVVPGRLATPNVFKNRNNTDARNESRVADLQSDIFDIILKTNSKDSDHSEAGSIVGGAEALFQGDIVMTDDLKLALENSGTDSLILPSTVTNRPSDTLTLPLVGRAVTANKHNRWPVVNGLVEVPFVIEQSSVPHQAVIFQAMHHWKNNVPCITFVHRNSQSDYVSFFSGHGCYSTVGRIGGKQRISIGPGCLNMGVIAHEIGHALGFWHEQSRPDRDQYVKILWKNIVSGKEVEFIKIKNTDNLGVPYDLASLMHYGPKAFSKSKSLNTIESLDGNTNFGQRNGLSVKDIEQAKLMYCQGTNVCLHKDKNSHCPWWAFAGYCNSSSIYFSFMDKNCKRSCYCNYICEDKGDHCASLSLSLCSDKQYKNYMSVYCKKRCHICS